MSQPWEWTPDDPDLREMRVGIEGAIKAARTKAIEARVEERALQKLKKGSSFVTDAEVDRGHNQSRLERVRAVYRWQSWREELAEMPVPPPIEDGPE